MASRARRHGVRDSPPDFRRQSRHSSLPSPPAPPSSYYPALFDGRGSRGPDGLAASRHAQRSRSFNVKSPQHYEAASHARRPSGYYSHERPGPSDKDRTRSKSRGNHGIPSQPSSISSRDRTRSKSQEQRGVSGTDSSPWWQNPIVRTCAMTAISTGLSAALDSRGDPGRWKGAKGAKVAVATVGSALVDGFLATKHPDGLRHKVLKKGMQVAMDEAEKKKHQGVGDKGKLPAMPRRNGKSKGGQTHRHGRH